MNTYISVIKDNIELGVLKFQEIEDTVKFFDDMYNNGYIIKKITEEYYNSFQFGDELTIDDIKKGNYRIE